MIIGGHIIVYSKDAERDRAFFKDVLKFDNVNVGHGWLIFKLPPAEVAVHPSDENDLHTLFLMSADLDAEIAKLKKAVVKCEPTTTQSYGYMTEVHLPGGGKLGLYQPR